MSVSQASPTADAASSSVGSHTPGPWRVEGTVTEGNAHGFIISAGLNDRHDGPAAFIGNLMPLFGYGGRVSQADAQLAASAPELLGFAQMVARLEEYPEPSNDAEEALNRLGMIARAAIAKATGAA